jgi:hypothetical protein
MGDVLSKANLISLLVILLVNLVIAFCFEKCRSVSAEELSKIRVTHIFWTVNWLLWLLSWFALANNMTRTTVILNDVGAFCLIACSITFSAGLDAVKKYALPLCSFLVLDCIYLLAFDVLVHESPSNLNETSITFSPPPQGFSPAQWNQVVSDMIHHHTVLFGPSLCLTMLALGLVSLTLARRSVHFELGIVFGFVGVLYAFAQITIYQSGLFVPFLTMSDGARLFLISWRILFVTAYWLAMLAAAGIAVAGTRVWGAVSTAVGLIGSVVALVNGLRKH